MKDTICLGNHPLPLAKEPRRRSQFAYWNCSANYSTPCQIVETYYQYMCREGRCCVVLPCAARGGKLADFNFAKWGRPQWNAKSWVKNWPQKQRACLGLLAADCAILCNVQCAMCNVQYAMCRLVQSAMVGARFKFKQAVSQRQNFYPCGFKSGKVIPENPRMNLISPCLITKSHKIIY